MSLKQAPRRSLDPCTVEYLEMGLDLTNKPKRYFSFHEKALNRNRDWDRDWDLQDRPASNTSADYLRSSVDELTADELPSSAAATTATADCRDSDELLSVNHYRETMKQCLLDCAKSFTNGFQTLRDVERDGTVAVDVAALRRCPRQLKNLLLLWACFVDRCDAVDALLCDGETDADYALPSRGYGAVHASALNGCVACLQRLLARGFEANGRVDGLTAVHLATFGDSADAVRALVRHGCRVEPTVLHSAVRSRAAACVRLLLHDYRVDPNALDATGSAPVHVAADQGFLDCMRALLSSERTLVDMRDSREHTALHLACDSAHVECARLLLDSGADVRAANGKRQTPMHVAARAQSVECIDLLARAGADPNARDADDRTPLHAAISVKTLNVCQAVDALLGHRARVNVQDHYGFTPLHLAALNEAPECVDSLLARGGNVGVNTYGGVSALNMIVRKVPSCVPAVARQLDAAVASNWTDGLKRGPEIQMRFKYLLDCNAVGEIDLLKCFQKEGQYELLQHPLCQAFLFLKWRKIRKYYLIRLVSLALFILLYTLYVLSVLSHNCYNEARQPPPTANQTAAESLRGCLQNNSALADFVDTRLRGVADVRVVMETILFSLYAVTVVEGFLKISEMTGYMYVHQYFLDLSNLSEWLVVLSVPCICASFHSAGRTYSWQNHVSAFCVLCAWTNFMVKIGQLPWFDTYVAMYTKVQREFTKLLMAYICLLIGFAVSLCVVFPTSPWFRNPVAGFVKVLVMMAGELDIAMLEDHDRSPLASKISAYVVYMALLVFVSIILMNLLVGIAVHDIQGLRKTAGLSKVRCQIKLIYYIELFMLRSFWPKKVKQWALVYPSKSRAYMTVKPLNQEQTLPRDIIDATRALIKRKKQDCHGGDDTFKIQEILKEVRDLRKVVEDNQKVIKHLLTNANKI